MRFGSMCKDTTARSSARLLIGTTASREVVVGQPLWAGVDAGKSDHYCVVIDADGKRLLSRRVANDEAALLVAGPTGAPHLLQNRESGGSSVPHDVQDSLGAVNS